MGENLKVATVGVESSGENMATRFQNNSSSDSDQDRIRDMDLKHVQNKPDKRTSLFIVSSFVYAKLLIVICISYVIAETVTHNIPLYYYEGFFTYLYGFSIFFLLYVFCFLLQESSCCSGNDKQPNNAKKKKKNECKEKEEKNRKEKEEKEKKKKEIEAQKKEKKKSKDKKKDKKQDKPDDSNQPISVQWQFDAEQTPAAATATAPAAPPAAAGTPQNDVESGQQHCENDANFKCKRKTSQNDQAHGSFFLRIGAIGFGLGTMIYIGLEFGLFFEVPFTSPCYMILRGINPVLQMIFTFMQMYFIFMNSRLNIHKFKVIARFGLMHIVATNICVWIRTFFIEYIKDITKYHLKYYNGTNISSERVFAESVKLHTLRNNDTVLGSKKPQPDPGFQLINLPTTTTIATFFNRFVTTSKSSPRNPNPIDSFLGAFPTKSPSKNYSGNWMRMLPTTTTSSSFSTTSTLSPTTTRTTIARIWRAITTSTTSTTTTTMTTTSPTTTTSTTSTTTPTLSFNNLFDSSLVRSITADNINDKNPIELFPELTSSTTTTSTTNVAENGEFLNDIIPQAFSFFPSFNAANASNTSDPDSCGRINIISQIVEQSSPYLYPFLVEFSLIGAAVIYVMWKHIGRNSKYVTEENLEHRLEIMLSRRAVALAQAHNQGRVDCVGASKGLFFGLLMLVCSLICLILFFVLISNDSFKMLAIYLAEVSHCAILILSIIAILIGFIRVKSLKFKKDEPNNLNDILLRISAFGLFLYAVFSVISGHLNVLEQEANLLAMVTGVLVVLQVILQLLFIGDVSRRRVHLPEHDRTKPGRQVVTFLLIANITMWLVYTFEIRKVEANPVQLTYFGYLTWAMVQRAALPLCIFHRFHSAVALAEIWKSSYKARLD